MYDDYPPDIGSSPHWNCIPLFLRTRTWCNSFPGVLHAGQLRHAGQVSSLAVRKACFLGGLSTESLMLNGAGSGRCSWPWICTDTLASATSSYTAATQSIGRARTRNMTPHPPLCTSRSTHSFFPRHVDFWVFPPLMVLACVACRRVAGCGSSIWLERLSILVCRVQLTPL